VKSKWPPSVLNGKPGWKISHIVHTGLIGGVLLTKRKGSERNLLQQELGNIRANYITHRETSNQGLCRNLTINARPCECRKVAQCRACMTSHGIGGILGERHVAQERHPVVLHRFVRTLLAGNRGGWRLGEVSRISALQTERHAGLWVSEPG